MDSLRSRLRGIYYALTSEAVPFHRGEEIQPFFIVGSGRCGTTLLRRILQASGEVHIPPENWSLGKVIRRFRQTRWLLEWKQIAESVVAAHEYRTWWFDEAPTEVFQEAGDWERGERSLQRLIDSLYSYHGETAGADFYRWGDKTPMNINHMESILEVFPKAQFVHLFRDGVDVIHSWKNREIYRNNVTKPAHRWKSAVQKAHSFTRCHPHRITEVRYERLCENPESVIQQLCDFLDIPYGKELLSRSDHYGEMEDV